MLHYREDADVAQLDSVRAARQLAAAGLFVISDADTDTPAWLGCRVFAAVPAAAHARLLELHGVLHGRYLLRDEIWAAADASFGWRARQAGEGGWRSDPESNRATGICSPLHNRSDIGPAGGGV